MWLDSKQFSDESCIEELCPNLHLDSNKTFFHVAYRVKSLSLNIKCFSRIFDECIVKMITVVNISN